MSSKARKLKNESVNPFMEEIDPKNPYGPNYEELPYDTKVYYKFNRVKKFVHIDKGDQETMFNYNFKYVFGMIGAVTLGCLTGYGIRRLFIKPYLTRTEDFIEQIPHLYYGVFFAGSATMAYYKLDEMYTKDICYPLLDKYLPEAIKNGFEDYTISQYRTMDMEFEQ